MLSGPTPLIPVVALVIPLGGTSKREFLPESDFVGSQPNVSMTPEEYLLTELAEQKRTEASLFAFFVVLGILLFRQNTSAGNWRICLLQNGETPSRDSSGAVWAGPKRAQKRRVLVLTAGPMPKKHHEPRDSVCMPQRVQARKKGDQRGCTVSHLPLGFGRGRHDGLAKIRSSLSFQTQVSYCGCLRRLGWGGILQPLWLPSR